MHITLRAVKRLAILLAIDSCLVCQARAEFTLIDNFESYTAGTPISGQGNWLAEAATNPVAAGVAIDPVNPANRALNIGAGGFTTGRLGHRETINTDPALRIAQGTTATLFFRVAWNTSQVDFSVGMSDVANPINDVIFNSFTQFESQFVVSFAEGYDKLRMRDGGSVKELTTNVQPLEWYSVWLVIDNATDSTQVYLQGGAFTNQVLLDSAGDRSFAFRNGVASNDLITLFIATGRNTDSLPPNPTENIGPVYLDDVHIDTSGINLTNPVPEPATVTLAGIALGTLALMVVRGRHKRRRY